MQLREAVLAPPVASQRTRFNRESILAGALLVIIGCLTFAPVLYVLISSFDVSGLSEPYRFGLEGWQDAFSNPKTLSSIGYSFLLSIRIPIAIALAFLIAWLLIRVQIPGRSFIEHALWFGFFLPTIPLTMGWILLLDENYGLFNEAAQRRCRSSSGPVFSIYSVPGIIWVHLSLTTIPVMVILLAPALRQFDAANEEAAEMAGAGILTTLRAHHHPADRAGDLHGLHRRADPQPGGVRDRAAPRHAGQYLRLCDAHLRPDQLGAAALSRRRWR